MSQFVTSKVGYISLKLVLYLHCTVLPAENRQRKRNIRRRIRTINNHKDNLLTTEIPDWTRFKFYRARHQQGLPIQMSSNFRNWLPNDE